MRGLLVLANNFEDAEALVSRDVLIRAHIRTYTISLDGPSVKSKTGLITTTDLQYKNLKDPYNYDFILIPGGPWVLEFVNAKDERYNYLINLIKCYFENNKHIFAICAAPLILDCAGILPPKYTCYPGVEHYIKSPSYKSLDGVVIDKKIITSLGPGKVFDFALAIIEELKGVDIRHKMEQELQYNNNESKR